MTMKKILYLGRNDNYIDAIDERLKTSFRIEKYDHQGKSILALKKILITSPSLIILDFYDNYLNLSKTINLIRLHHQLQVLPVICITQESAQKEMERLSLVAGVAYFVRSVDMDDAIYCIKALLAPELLITEKTAKAVFQEHTQLSDIVWINNVNSSHLIIETNRFFKNGDEIKVNIPYFSSLFRLQKHKIASDGSKTAQMPFRNSYRLDYVFSYDQLRPEDRTKLLTEFKYKIESLPIKEFTYEWIQEFEKKPKKILLVSDKDQDLNFDPNMQHVALSVRNLETSAKTIIFNWVQEETKGKVLTKDTITIYQQSYGLLESGTPFLDQANTVVKHRQIISHPIDEIMKDRPTVIAIFVDEGNTIEKVSELVKAMTAIKDYFPFIILFNFSSEDIEEIRTKLQYHFVITTKVDVSESLILKMLELYRKKKLEKDLKRIYKFFESMKLKGMDLGLLSEQLFFDHRAFRKTEDKQSFMYLGLPIEIKWMTEFEIVFSSEQQLYPGEVLLLEFPIRLSILIVPHLKGSKESLHKNLYRGLIHFVSDTDKKILRRFINHVATLSEVRGKALTHQEIEGVKKQFFPR
jgi:DNA-binding NarL/FixJ family response regulator